MIQNDGNLITQKEKRVKQIEGEGKKEGLWQKVNIRREKAAMLMHVCETYRAQ